MSQDGRRIRWRTILLKVGLIPVLSILVMTTICKIIVVPSTYLPEAIESVPSMLPEIGIVIVVQFLIGTVLYAVVRYRRRIIANLSFYLITVTYIAGSLIVTFYTLYLIVRPYIQFPLLLPLLMMFSVVLSVILIQWFVGTCPVRKYLAALISSLAAAMNIVLYLPPSFSLLLLALMPIVDVILVYFGPLGRLIQELRKTQLQRTAQSYKMQPCATYSTNPIIRMTVQLDGLMLGIGDFLLYSLASMWSTVVLLAKFGTIALALVLLLLVYLPLFLVAFYVNIRLCLRRSYGPAATLPLVTALVFTLSCYYLLPLK